MAVMSKYTHVPYENGKNHEGISCGMKSYIDKPFRIVLRVVMHLRKRLIQGRLFVRAGFYRSLDFVL